MRESDRCSTSVVRARGYVRVSTEEQTRNHSLSHQGEAIKDYTRENQLWLQKVYEEGGASAWGERGGRRTEWGKMMEDARAGRFDVLVVTEPSRVSRDLESQVLSLHELRRQGVEVVFVAEPRDMSEMHRKLLRNILGALHQAESDWKSQRVKEAFHRLAKEGRFKGSAPYGYSNRGKGGVLEVVPEEAAVVRRVHELFQETRNLNEVARRLRGEGIRSPKGGVWHRHVLRRILTNPVYVGRIVVKAGEYAGRHEAIVGQEQFAASQGRLKGGSARGTRGRASLLAGVAVCGYCGSKMFISCGRKGRRSYMCSREHGKAPEQKCGYRQERGRVHRRAEGVLEDEVMRGLKSVHREAVEEWAAKERAKWQDRHARRIAELELLRDEMEKVRVDHGNLLALRIRGEIEETEFRRAKEEYNAKLERIETDLNTRTLAAEEGWAEEGRLALEREYVTELTAKQPPEPMRARDVIRQLLCRIVVRENEIEMVFHSGFRWIVRVDERKPGPGDREGHKSGEGQTTTKPDAPRYYGPAGLAAMLLPALASAREKARRSNCLSNLSQFGRAAESYLGDYGGYYPCDPSYGMADAQTGTEVRAFLIKDASSSTGATTVYEEFVARPYATSYTYNPSTKQGSQG